MRNLAIPLWAATLFFLAPLCTRAVEATTAVRVTPLLKASSTWHGEAIQYPQGQAEVTALQIEIAPGGETGWHLHPVPSFAFVQQGELQVTLKDGTFKVLKAGDAFAEVVNTWHNGKNVGKEPVKLLVLYTGAVGVPLTRKADPE
ncbi:cupin domain-containing protein [Burkholderiaceae bacterium DAT-1]|nr:cupin domain-containing protein [Burkholderiaceae bacterium DAT-1]